MMVEANVKDLYLVLVALATLCVGLGAMLMWMVSERQHERHVREFREMMRRDGRLIPTGTRIRWGTRLVAAMNDLWAYPENNPDNAPALWEEIAYLNGYRVLCGPISASNPVQPGEMCWEDGELYRCIYHVACTYRPSEYAAAWEEVTAE